MILPPLRSTLFPYTTLFRSQVHRARRDRGAREQARRDAHQRRARVLGTRHRSEEHTSELQSLRHLVCRLLLEKKKPTSRRSTPTCSTSADRTIACKISNTST